MPNEILNPRELTTKEYRLWGSKPDGWAPECILHYFISVSAEAVLEKDIEVSYRGVQIIPPHGDPGPVPDIDLYAMIVAANGSGKPFERIRATAEPSTTLDIGIPKNCYVLFELDVPWNWDFRLADCITTKLDQGDRYFTLRLYNGPTQPRRRVAYFGAQLREGDYGPHDEFNIHLSLSKKDHKPLDIVIDPDIRNPGNPSYVEMVPFAADSALVD